MSGNAPSVGAARTNSSELAGSGWQLMQRDRGPPLRHQTGFFPGMGDMMGCSNACRVPTPFILVVLGLEPARLSGCADVYFGIFGLPAVTGMSGDRMTPEDFRNDGTGGGGLFCGSR